MNLMKYFNRNYMVQNIKKSKSVLAFFLGIIPIINLLAFIILITNVDYKIVNLETISIVHFFGIYFIPIILSVCLFGFVYKKKSVDFIGSMPISKKGIFLSNTIGGILLLLAMVLLCALGIYFTSLFTGFILPFRMISDYILIWSITYIFVFIMSNIAMSVSGNISTQFVVTLLILFFVPFIVDYISDLCNLTYLQPSHYAICLEGSELCHGASREIITNYTIPYNNLRGDFQIWNVVSIIKMTILSIVGYFIGYFFYSKRQMEVNETSFKNLKTHNIVKAFTMVPIIFFIIELIPDIGPNDHLPFLLIICILLGLLIYYFIYDLITRKTISNIKTSLKHFCVTLVILLGISYIFHSVFTDKGYTVYIQDKDITGYQIPINNSFFTNSDYVTVKDPEILSLLTQDLKKSNSWEEGDQYLEIRMLIKDISYKIWVSLPTSTYEELFEMIENAKKVEVADGLFNSNKVFALGANLEEVSKKTTNMKLIKEAKKVVKDRNSCDADKKLHIPISLYVYQDGKIYSYQVDSCTNDYLNDYAVSSIQKENERLYQNINHQYTNGNINVWMEHYPDSIEKLEINIHSYIVGYRSKILSFIRKNYKDTFSSSKEYISFTVSLNGKYYTYCTNKVDEIMDLLDISGDEKYDTN